MGQHLIVTLLLWLVVSGGAAFGQEAPVLVVTLKDMPKHPIAGARVIVRDSSGDRDIARATTDAQGVAAFSTLVESDIRVATLGQLSSGAKLFQPGNDARGMLVFLQAGTTHIALLADVDGLVAPDPRTMAALEPGIPVVTEEGVVFPTAPVAAMPTATAIPAVRQPTFLALTGQGVGAGPDGGAAETEAASAQANPLVFWLGVGLLALLIGYGIGTWLVPRPRR